jgi:snapalysin
LSRRVFARISAGLLGAAVIVGPQLFNPAAASAAAPRILYYDASRAAEFVAAVNQGASNWNSSVANVRLMPVTPGRRGAGRTSPCSPTTAGRAPR